MFLKAGHDITFTIAFGTILLLLLAIIIIISILQYQKRQRLFETEKMQSQLEIQEQTLNHISREIHDNVGQVLSLAKVQINILEHGNTVEQSVLADLKENIGKAMQDLRDIAKSLNTDRIQLHSLAESTAHELRRIDRLGEVKTTFELNGTENGIPEQAKLIIFRIIQESLQNIMKHAQAKTILVSFNFEPKIFTCHIKDDGRGFELDKLNSSEGLGLQNIRNRATLINGNCEINSQLNKGTTIKITLPYE